MSHLMYLTLAGARGLTSAHPGLSLPERRARHRRFARGGEEPTLRDLMADPLTHAVMGRDNVSANDIAAVIGAARSRLRARRAA